MRSPPWRCDEVGEAAGAFGAAHFAADVFFGGCRPLKRSRRSRSVRPPILPAVASRGAGRCGPSRWRSVCRGSIRFGRFRFRDAGRRGRGRRRGCRTSRRAVSCSSPSIRCASRGGPCPRGCPTTVRPAWRISRARSRRRAACVRPPPPPSPCTRFERAVRELAVLGDPSPTSKYTSPSDS